MSVVTLGKGPQAVRVAFGDGAVELRYRSTVISGNADMARALACVVRHPEVDEAAVAELGPGVTAATVCDLLRRLAEHGLPVTVWGPGWAGACGRYEEAAG